MASKSIIHCRHHQKSRECQPPQHALRKVGDAHKQVESPGTLAGSLDNNTTVMALRHFSRKNKNTKFRYDGCMLMLQYQIENSLFHAHLSTDSNRYRFLRQSSLKLTPRSSFILKSTCWIGFRLGYVQDLKDKSCKSTCLFSLPIASARVDGLNASGPGGIRES